MRSSSEKIIEKRLAAEVKKAGGLCIKLLCDQFSGLPDRMCLFPGGKIVFVELKSTGQKPRPLQIVVHNKFRALGFRVEVIDTIEGINELLQDYDTGKIQRTD
jgi:hypothetical protein